MHASHTTTADDLQRIENVLDETALPVETRRDVLKKAAVGLAAAGGLGAVGLVGPGSASAHPSGPIPFGDHKVRNDPATILAVATTAEVLATIVNTVGAEKVELDRVTRRNVRAAAREELVHYNVLVKLGGTAITKRIWVPDAVFANATNLLSTLEVGDQIFVNAYLLGTLEFGYRGQGALACITAEFMGVEGVHRALARQSLGKLGNDRVFMKFDQPEQAPDAPNRGQKGFEKITTAVTQLQMAGFGFGAEGAKPGRFYDFNNVKERTPSDPDLNTFIPDPD
jgi:hypothetical protein